MLLLATVETDKRLHGKFAIDLELVEFHSITNKTTRIQNKNKNFALLPQKVKYMLL